MYTPVRARGTDSSPNYNNSYMTSYQHYNKISLSKSDLRHVYSQFAQAAQAKIQHHLPGSSRQDPLQVQVENLLNQHITEVFELARYSLIVDGVDLADEDVSIQELLHLQPTEEVVPFDTELNQNLRNLIEAVEKETTEVTRLRRELPSQARDAYEQLVAATDDEVTRLFEAEEEKEEKEQEEKEKKKEKQETGGARVLAELGLSGPDLRAQFSESINSLCCLQDELPGHTARVQTLSETIDFLVEAYDRQRREDSREQTAR